MFNVPKPQQTGGGRGKVLPWLPRYAESIIYSLNWTDQNVWRTVVASQPVALLCRDKIVDTLASMEWRIEPKDPAKRQELRLKIKHYTDLFSQNKEQGVDFIDLVTHVMEDALDLPFGAGIELIREGDKPSGKLRDFVLLDGATLFPTNNRDFPVVQRVDGDTNYIVFPKHAINRVNYSLRREINWNGWAFPPPQKIWVAIQMLSKGDKYYWKLLIDTPEAGILDLLDMEKDSAEAWLESFRELLTGIDPFKVPVLYEHTKEAKYIPFSRPPTEIMYDKAISRYDALTAGGYGLSLSSIGLSSASNGGETLAGAIRQERNDRSRGIGLAKVKFKSFMDRCLPDDLEFKWVDPDDEQQVARGRAKLSLSTAYSSLINDRVLSHKEARADLINSGLLTATIPEEIPEEDVKALDEMKMNQGFQNGNLPFGKPPKRQNMLTATQPPSAGGQGEIRKSISAEDMFSTAVEKFLSDENVGVFDLDLTKFLNVVYDLVDEIYEENQRNLPFYSLSKYKSLSSDTRFSIWEDVRKYLVGLRDNFESKCLAVLENREDFPENVVEFLTGEIVKEFAGVLTKSINIRLEINN